MLENILLAIVLPLLNAGEYFVGYCHAISECWRIFCWLLSLLGHKVVMLAATRGLSHLSTQPRRGLITKVSHRIQAVNMVLDKIEIVQN